MHLPVRAEALRAALGTAGHHSFMKGFALHPFCDGGGVGNTPINCNFHDSLLSALSRSPFRSTFPLGVSGMTASFSQKAGIM